MAHDLLVCALRAPRYKAARAFSAKVDTGLVQKMRQTKAWSAFLDSNQVESAPDLSMITSEDASS